MSIITLTTTQCSSNGTCPQWSCLLLICIQLNSGYSGNSWKTIKTKHCWVKMKTDSAAAWLILPQTVFRNKFHGAIFVIWERLLTSCHVGLVGNPGQSRSSGPGVAFVHSGAAGECLTWLLEGVACCSQTCKAGKRWNDDLWTRTMSSAVNLNRWFQDVITYTCCSPAVTGQHVRFGKALLQYRHVSVSYTQ